jgi:hypothetical protein
MQKTLNREDIIRKAQEVGLPPCAYSDYGNQIGNLESFAALVVAAEREACAKILDEMAGKDRLSNYFQVAAIAIRARGQQ